MIELNRKSDVELKTLLEEVTANDQSQSNLNNRSDKEDHRTSAQSNHQDKTKGGFSLKLNTYTLRLSVIILLVCLIFILGFLFFNDEIMTMF